MNTRSESVSSPTRPLSQSSILDSDLDRNVDALFKAYTIPEVSKTLAKLRLENAKMKSDLFNMIGENYDKIIEAANAVESMKRHANDIKATFEQIERGELHAAPSEEDGNIGKVSEEHEALLKLLDDIMTCQVQAWKRFRDKDMTGALDHCTETLAKLKRNRASLLKITQPSLLNCMEIQISSTQVRLKQLASKMLLDEENVNLSSLDTQSLLQALLLHSGLYTSTHYSQEDLSNTFMSAWKSMKSSPRNEAELRRAVLKNVQILMFGLETVEQGSRAALCDLFSLRIRELVEESSSPGVVDMAIIEAFSALDNPTITQKTLIRNVAIETAFKAWIEKTWSDVHPVPLATFKITSEFQSFYSTSNFEAFKDRAGILREYVKDKLGSDLLTNDFNLLTFSFHPDLSEVPCKKFGDETGRIFKAVPLFSMNVT